MSLSELVSLEAAALPEDKLGEVLDFIKFLRNQTLEQDVLKLSEKSLAQYWNTKEEDAAWSNL